MINLHLGDCMEALAGMKDKCFDLAIVDPDYGLNDKLTCGGTWAAKYKKGDGNFGGRPNGNYFSELRRVSKNQIIWGGNYFTEFIAPARCFICWVKPEMIGMHTMADCELALTSFDQNARRVEITKNGENRIHICQKPVALYRWLLDNYAKPGDRILDTHGGSMSIAIACHDLGFDLDLWEIDEDYFKAGADRLKRHQAQGRLF